MLKIPVIKSPHMFVPNNTHTAYNQHTPPPTLDNTKDNNPHTFQNTIYDTLGTDKPEEWGPSFWFTIHNGVSGYPYQPNDITKTRMKWFIRGLTLIIPCTSCRIHATKFIETTDLNSVVENKHSLVKFFVDMHNIVNKRLGKPEIPFGDVITHIYPFRDIL